MFPIYDYFFAKPEVESFRDDVHKTPLFSGLSRAELTKVLNQSSLRQFRKGEHIFFDGDPSAAAYIILSGKVEICKTGSKHIVLSTLSSGMFFGEIALVSDAPRSATAKAAEDALLLCIFKHDFEKIARHYPRLGSKLLLTISQILAQRLRLTNEQLVKK